MRGKSKAVCDLCRKEFDANMFEDREGTLSIRVPVFHHKVPDDLLRKKYKSIDEYLEQITENAEWAIGYSTYDLCKECLNKVVKLRCFPFPNKIDEEKYEVSNEYGVRTLLSRNVYLFGGLDKTVVDDGEFDIKEEVKNAFLESREKNCQSCRHRQDNICLFTGGDCERSYALFEREWLFEPKSCERWEFRDFGGKKESENE